MRRAGPDDRTTLTTAWRPVGRSFWPTVVAAAALLGFFVALWPVPSVTAFALAIVAIAVILSREFAVGAILVSAMVTLGAVSWLGLPVQAGLLTKILIGLLVFGVILDWNSESRLAIPVVFLMLVAVLMVSASFGSGGRFLAVQALGAYIAAPVAYLAIVHSNLSMKSVKRLGLVVLFILAAQPPILVIQSRLVGNVDDIGGTFGMGGSTQMLAIVFGIAWTIAVAMLTGRKRSWLIPIGVVFAVALMINQAKAGFVFAAAGTIVVGFTKVVLNPRREVLVFLFYVVLSLASIAALFGAYVYLGPILPGGEVAAYFWVNWLSNPSAVLGYLFSTDSGGQAGRLEGTRLVLAQVQTLADLLIGKGPGLLSGSALLGQDAGSASALGLQLSWATSLTRWLLEVGLAGVALYLASIGAAVTTVAKSWVPRGDELGRSITAAAVGSAAIYISAALYHAPWTTDAIAVPFWCLLGLAVRAGQETSAECRDAPGAPDPSMEA